MIKATIQNSPYCTEIRFPCSKTELSRKLGEIKMNPEHLAPMATVIDIEPVELSMLTDCDVSLDALNYLGKRLDGMDEREYKQFLAALSCPKISEVWGLKNIINLTDNLARFTLVEDTNDVEFVGRIHMLNVRGGLSESEYQDKDWLAAEGKKLLESGTGIDTEYGKLFINEDIPFEENFNGTTFPPYLYNGSPVAVDIGYMGLTETIELPCEDITIKKALCRLGAEGLKDCKILVDSMRDITDEWSDRISEVEKTKDIFGLNNLLKTEDILLKQEQPISIFNKEVSRILGKNGFTVSENKDCITVFSDGNEVAKIFENGMISATNGTSGDAYFEIKKIAGAVSEYCSAYEKAAPLKAEGLSGNYRCLSEFNGTVLAAKHTEYGFEFVTWDRTYDGKAVCQGNYHNNYMAAKENFAVRSGLVDKDKLFSTEELEQIGKCVDFTMRHNDNLNFDDCECLKKLNEKILESLSELQSEALEMSM